MTFVPSIHLYLKRAASTFAYDLSLVSQARPSLFCSADHFHYQYPICAISAAAETERVWLARLTCLSDKFLKKSHVCRLSVLKTMSEKVQKTPKQWSTQRNLHRWLNQNSFLRLPPWLWAHSQGTRPSSCRRSISTKDHSSLRDNWTEQLDHNKFWKVAMRHWLWR